MEGRIIADLVVPPFLTIVWVLIGRPWVGPLKNHDGIALRWWNESRTWWILIDGYIILFALTALDYYVK